MYTAAKSMLGSSKLPVKMAGISLSTALYAAEGDAARSDLGVEDMEPRIKSQVWRMLFLSTSTESVCLQYVVRILTRVIWLKVSFLFSWENQCVPHAAYVFRTYFIDSDLGQSLILFLLGPSVCVPRCQFEIILVVI